VAFSSHASSEGSLCPGCSAPLLLFPEHQFEGYQRRVPVRATSRTKCCPCCTTFSKCLNQKMTAYPQHRREENLIWGTWEQGPHLDPSQGSRRGTDPLELVRAGSTATWSVEQVQAFALSKTTCKGHHERRGTRVED
jgi:hypothetical protein